MNDDNGGYIRRMDSVGGVRFRGNAGNGRRRESGTQEIRESQAGTGHLSPEVEGMEVDRLDRGGPPNPDGTDPRIEGNVFHRRGGSTVAPLPPFPSQVKNPRPCKLAQAAGPAS